MLAFTYIDMQCITSNGSGHVKALYYMYIPTHLGQQIKIAFSMPTIKGHVIKFRVSKLLGENGSIYCQKSIYMFRNRGLWFSTMSFFKKALIVIQHGNPLPALQNCFLSKSLSTTCQLLLYPPILDLSMHSGFPTVLRALSHYRSQQVRQYSV